MGVKLDAKTVDGAVAVTKTVTDTVEVDPTLRSPRLHVTSPTPPTGGVVHEPALGERQRIAPEVAGPIGERFAASGLGMLGTVRSNGAPRVSPIEVGPYEGGLFVGMMPEDMHETFKWNEDKGREIVL